MNRYQITADIDATMWLGNLAHHKDLPNKIGYMELEQLFDSEDVYLPSRKKLENQLLKLKTNIKHEFLAYLRETADEIKFGMYILEVNLPLGNEAFVSQFGNVSTFVDGTFEVVMDMPVSREDVYDIVSSALDMAIDSVSIGTDNLSALNAVCLDVKKIGN